MTESWLWVASLGSCRAIAKHGLPSEHHRPCNEASIGLSQIGRWLPLWRRFNFLKGCFFGVDPRRKLCLNIFRDFHTIFVDIQRHFRSETLPLFTNICFKGAADRPPWDRLFLSIFAVEFDSMMLSIHNKSRLLELQLKFFCWMSKFVFEPSLPHTGAFPNLATAFRGSFPWPFRNVLLFNMSLSDFIFKNGSKILKPEVLWPVRRSHGEASVRERHEMNVCYWYETIQLIEF